MSGQDTGEFAITKTLDNDAKNLAVIQRALADGKIDADTSEYLTRLYSDSITQFREVFHVLGKCFGAPKAGVMEYDYDTDSGLPKHINISDIFPLRPYLVQHRLDADPMRNQFFTTGAGHKIDLFVSSIVSVIVAAQKKVERALEKITGKYYRDYISDVAKTAETVIASHERAASGRAIADKIRTEFSNKFITRAAETVLGIIGPGHERIAADLVRALDCVPTPYQRLQDVWRVKCLFDLVPQARTFIERIRDMMPDRIISIRDKFYDMENPRNYRDAKLIIDIGHNGVVMPMEIICQVRTFFEYERKTHVYYEKSRKTKNAKSEQIEQKLAEFMEDGIREYNEMICECAGDLFERVGWNILYGREKKEISLFEGFPKPCSMYYPQKMVDKIMDKLDNAIENEVFHIIDAPAKLDQSQESEIFHFIARFILVSAMPYMNASWSVSSDTMSGKLFNFVMKEVQRYYKK